MINIASDRFVDEHGRTLMLRGVNLGGSSKVPVSPDGATWRPDGLRDPEHASFVGRPLPLDEADEHFARLAHWGFTLVRLLTTWEAIEHAGPRRYDEAYLDYFRGIVEKAAEHGIAVIVDPHQDVWSRPTGGDGAPAWTLAAVGFDLEALVETGAAITHQAAGEQYPTMIWPTNYGKLANLTMWTLFFGGDTFAPRLRIDGTPAQRYLQEHYMGAVSRLAERLAGLSNVIGFDTLNEPSPGLIGRRSLDSEPAFALRLGPVPTPLQAFALGDGFALPIDTYALGLAGFRRTGSTLLNAGRRRSWRDGVRCIWQEHGVWDVGSDGAPRILRPDHFARHDGRDVDFARDFYLPFARRFAEAMRRRLPDAVIFAEGPPESGLALRPGDLENAAWAPHWYDGVTLLRKTYTPWLGADVRTGRVVFGRRRVARSFAEQIGWLIAAGREAGMPTLIGECGVPFDLDGKRAYRTGDFSRQTQALDATMRALEANLANFTVWNYTADNTNAHGDGWNDEDFSIFSRDQMRGTGGPDDGGRALRAVVRPYPMAVPGEPLASAFDGRTRRFACRFRFDPHISAPAVFFVPVIQYPEGVRIEAPAGRATLDGQLLTYAPDPEVPVHEVGLRPA